jgi:feruloyl-CoA synthase
MTGVRPVKLWDADVRQETRADGTILVWQAEPLGPYPRCLSDRIDHWAEVAPDRTWMAERDDVGGGWRTVSFGELARLQRRVGSALLGLACRPSGPC